MPEPRYENPSLTKGAGMQLEQGNNSNGAHQDTKALMSRRFRDSRTEKNRYYGSADRLRRYYQGDQWGNKLRPAWKAKPTPNYCFGTIETIIPMMVANRPTINVVSAEPGWEELADKMQDVIRRVFAINKMEQKYPIILRDSHIYGDGFAKIWYNPLKDDIEISPLDPRNLFPSPGSIWLQDCEYVILAFNRWIDSIERDFPLMKGKIPSGTWDDALTHQSVHTQKEDDGSSSGFVNTTSGPIAIDPYGASGSQNEKMATQIEVWERDKEGNPIYSVLVNGEVCETEDKGPLDRIASPFRHKLYPLAKCPCYPINSQFWSMSEMSQLESPQDMINRMEAMVADVIRMCSNPQMLIPRGGRISMKDITNRIGGFIVHEDGKPPVWMPPPSFPGQMFEAQSNAVNHMNTISGVWEAARGAQTVKAASGVAIKALQGATGGRTGLKTVMFEVFLQDVAMQVIPLVQQFYQNRTVRVGRGKYVDLNKFVPKTGRVDPKTDVGSARFEVEIGVGSTLPVDKGVRFDQSLEMRKMGDLDRRTFIQDSGRTEEQVDEILKNLDKEMAQAQAAQGPQQGAPPPGAASPQGQPGSEQDANAVNKAEQELATPEPLAGEGMPTDQEIDAVLQGGAP